MSEFSAVLMSQAKGVVGLAMLVTCCRALRELRNYRLRFFAVGTSPLLVSQNVSSRIAALQAGPGESNHIQSRGLGGVPQSYTVDGVSMNEFAPDSSPEFFRLSAERENLYALAFGGVDRTHCGGVG